MDAKQLLFHMISIVLHHLFHLNLNFLYLKTFKLICICLCRSNPNHWLKMDPHEYAHLEPQNLWASPYMADKQASSRRERGKKRKRKGQRGAKMQGDGRQDSCVCKSNFRIWAWGTLFFHMSCFCGRAGICKRKSRRKFQSTARKQCDSRNKDLRYKTGNTGSPHRLEGGRGSDRRAPRDLRKETTPKHSKFRLMNRFSI